MEENQPKTIKEFALSIAIIAGLARVTIDFLPKIIDAGPVVYYATFFICFIAEIILLRYAIKKYRTLNNDTISVKQALLVGVTIMAVVGTFYGVSSYVYDAFLDPNFQSNTMVKWGKMWGGEAEAAIMKQLEENPPVPRVLNIFMSILWFSFLGLVFSAIIGSVMKRPKN